MSFYAQEEVLYIKAPSLTTPRHEPVDDDQFILNREAPIRNWKQENSVGLQTGVSAFQGANKTYMNE